MSKASVRDHLPVSIRLLYYCVTYPFFVWLAVIMAKLFTPDDAAKAMGVSPMRVRELMRKHGIGTKVFRSWALTAEDLAKLKRIRRPGPGRPSTAE